MLEIKCNQSNESSRAVRNCFLPVSQFNCGVGANQCPNLVKTMMKIWTLLSLLVVVFCQSSCSEQPANSHIGDARGGYGGGGDYGGYGGGYGGHGHGSISMDPVSILGLLSLGAVLLRSILTLLPTSARSLDVADINLPLMLSDIPEAIANWHEMKSNQHVVYERSADEDDGDPIAPIRQYLSMLKTDKSCLPHYLCEFWKHKSMEEETFLDIVMLTTAEWNGLTKSAAIYDQLKQRNSSATAERYCVQARFECTA